MYTRVIARGFDPQHFFHRHEQHFRAGFHGNAPDRGNGGWQGEGSEAADLVEKAVEANGDDYNLYIPYRNALQRLGRGDEARSLAARQIVVLERQLDARDFLRIHRSCIVRVDSVRELHRESDGSGAIVIKGGVRLRVARGRWNVLEKKLVPE